jgi:hypothetical protein
MSTFSMGRKFELARSPVLTRSRLNFTDSALNSSPLWNLTPRRSLTSHVVGHQLWQLRGQRGHGLEVLIPLHQRIEQMARHHRGRRLLLVLGVERRGIHTLGDHDPAFRRRPGQTRRQEQGQRE